MFPNGKEKGHHHSLTAYRILLPHLEAPNDKFSCVFHGKMSRCNRNNSVFQKREIFSKIYFTTLEEKLIMSTTPCAVRPLSVALFTWEHSAKII